MKVLFLLAFMTFFTISSFAQVQLLPKKPKPTADFLNKYKYVPVQKPGLFVYPKATLMGSYAYGKIYRLPLDNMPCLVPDASLITQIPNAGIKGFQYYILMLNSYQKNDLVPAH